jgi:hypothetical protein
VLSASLPGALPLRKPSPLLPFVTAGGAFMQRLDSTIIGTSLPQIAERRALGRRFRFLLRKAEHAGE